MYTHFSKILCETPKYLPQINLCRHVLFREIETDQKPQMMQRRKALATLPVRPLDMFLPC